MIRFLALSLGLTGLLASSGAAATIYGQSASLTGSRTEADFVVGGNYASDNLIQSISWSITQNAGTYSYSYTLTNFSRPDISHFILDLTDDITTIGTAFNPPAGTGPYEFGNFGQSPSNPGFPLSQSIVGVKFDFGGGSPLTYTFTSDRAPVWGDWYVKGGSGSFAFNSGLANRETISELAFVARPNGAPAPPVVPEPGSMVLAALGLGLVGLSRVVRSRRKQA